MKSGAYRWARVIGWLAGLLGSLASQAQPPGAGLTTPDIVVLRLDTLRLATVKLRARPEATDRVNFNWPLPQEVAAYAPASSLFKSVDTLVYYARIGGTGPRLRQGVIRTPTAGVKNKRTIDLRVPTGAAAGGRHVRVYCLRAVCGYWHQHAAAASYRLHYVQSHPYRSLGLRRGRQPRLAGL